MKKVFIVLLIAAIGVGVYFYSRQKSKTSTSNFKQLVVGKWKVDSLTFKKDTTVVGRLLSHLLDSSHDKYEFEFSRDGSVYKVYDRKTQDTSQYEFGDQTTLLISTKDDTIKHRWSIRKLDSSIMKTIGEDSTVFFFSRVGWKNQDR